MTRRSMHFSMIRNISKHFRSALNVGPRLRPSSCAARIWGTISVPLSRIQAIAPQYDHGTEPASGGSLTIRCRRVGSALSFPMAWFWLKHHSQRCSPRPSPRPQEHIITSTGPITFYTQAQVCVAPQSLVQVIHHDTTWWSIPLNGFFCLCLLSAAMSECHLCFHIPLSSSFPCCLVSSLPHATQHMTNTGCPKPQGQRPVCESSHRPDHAANPRWV
ncbi:uncharacterized protein B0T23DRAFT_205140 [Neurospora hispaniola]|uniref:Uncharacterized protein n=1 Tax=Neurospora hispaniola TaxID=588809 RepID=A0AAJ0MQ62_9PEZI|nr:hypothetical protein B0T23DRAFT_205140 [Neurospora hispaniola]